jgi:hypothetical protein
VIPRRPKIIHKIIRDLLPPSLPSAKSAILHIVVGSDQIIRRQRKPKVLYTYIEVQMFLYNPENFREKFRVPKAPTRYIKS